MTDADGRIGDLLGRPLEAGRYRLRFQLGERSPFFTALSVDIVVEDVEPELPRPAPAQPVRAVDLPRQLSLGPAGPARRRRSRSCAAPAAAPTATAPLAPTAPLQPRHLPVDRRAERDAGGRLRRGAGAAVRGRAALPRPARGSPAVRTYADLWPRALAIARAMPEAEQLELINAHPRLGAPPAEVSALSFREQGYDRAAGRRPRRRRSQPAGAEAAASEAGRIAAELERLNAAYEARFGFRFCVFVDGRSRAALLPVIEAALEADRPAEIRRALGDVVAIAADRARSARSG